MPLTYEEITNEAMKLTREERVDLAKRLWQSVDPPADLAGAWNAEIARRAAQLDAGEVTTYPAEQIIAELRARLR